MLKKKKRKIIILSLVLSFVFGFVFGFVLTKNIKLAIGIGLIGIVVGFGILASLNLIRFD